MSTVLLVQPDSELSDIWRVALESSGHDVVSAGSSKAGVSHVREGGIDVIVVDSGEGEELTALVDELARLPDAPPIVLISDRPNAPEVSAHIGAAAFLPKPCSPGDLDHVVARVAGIPASQMVDDEPTKPIPIPE